MKYGVYLPNFGVFGDARVMASLAKEAEDAGWDGFFIWDHVARPIVKPLVDPFVALTAIAMTTETILFGAMVTPLARRRPQVLARQTVSLDVLSGGRLVMGVGLGSGRDEEWANFEEETDLKTRAQMTDEALDILAGLWTGEPFSYEGAHYKVGESQFLPAPVQQPRIPIWIAGYYPYKAPMRRASRWDGMFILYGDADDPMVALRDSVDFVQEQRTADSPFDVVYLDTSPAGASEEAIADLARQSGEAGATWWLANIAPWRYGIAWEDTWNFDRMRATILAGPPK